MRYYLLFIYLLSFPFQCCFSQSIEQAWDLRFSPIGLSDVAYCRAAVDSTQTTDEGFHPMRIKFHNEKVLSWSSGFIKIKKDAPLPIMDPPKENGCGFYWSRTVVLPDHARKNVCTVILNCKSEIDSLRFVVIALDKEENELHTDSVVIHPTAQWTDYSLAFRKKGVRAVQILIRHRGNVDANEDLSVYLSRIKISVGNQELNNLPVESLVASKDRQLKTQAIVPLSLDDDASLAKLGDWKDKKIIALGEQPIGIQDVREVQIQWMRHLIASENCKLILLELPEDLCVRWNLYLLGKQTDRYEDQLTEELKSVLHSSTVLFEFLKWVRQYNAKADVPVRVAGIDNLGDRGFRGLNSIYLIDYLLKLSTNRQDSAYYVRGMNEKKYPEVKDYILQSQLSNTLSTRDFQYLLFLMDEHIRMHALFQGINVKKESDFDKAKRIERVIDLYLSSAEKAVFIASSKRINKRLPIRDSDFDSDLLGSYLHQQYGKQYQAISIQIGERTCLVDTYYPDSASMVHDGKTGFPWGDPVSKRIPFPFAFEGAGMDSGNPYFYYPSSQLPEGILGLKIGYSAFRYCHIPAHFDALVFIREAKAMGDLKPYNWGLVDAAKEMGIRLYDFLDGLKENLQ